MCGIAGIVGSGEGIKRMTDAMLHRGPDGEGVYIDGSVALGHRRLSIIDLAAGQQPMSGKSGLCITFNGEIYNFREVRAGLEKKGYRFATNSDTEVILYAYEEYGSNCLKLLRGMFAFAIWDKKKSRLFIARDRLGKKPLYYYFKNNTFIFASEIKAIVQNEHVPRELDISSLHDYLTYMYIPYPKTIFKDIYKLPPSHFLELDVSGRLHLSIGQYWDLNFTPDYHMTEGDWVDGLWEKFKESVKIRLVSDVPLGAFLSGGLDSSAVVAMMSKITNKPVMTFSIGFQEAGFNELDYARQVSAQYSTKHYEEIVRPDAIDILPLLAWEFDEPFADSSAIPTYYLSKMAAKHVTVILSGDGGDEVFAGYDRYRYLSYYSRFDIPPCSLFKPCFGMVSDLMPDGMKGKGVLRHMSRRGFDRYAGMVTNSYLTGLLSDDLKPKAADLSFLNNAYNAHPDADYLSRIQYTDIKTYLAEDILTKVDRASMLCSLETRAPLLDHELLEFAAKIPASLKQGKYIFRKMLADALPQDILHRKKKGFDLPVSQWFKNDLAAYSRDILLSSKAGIFNLDKVADMLDNNQKAGRDFSSGIWSLLFFEHWCRIWLD